MADRLQRALRELAAALDEAAEEDRWEVVRVLEEVAPALRGDTRQNEDTQLAQSVSAPVRRAGTEEVSQDSRASPPRTQVQPPVLKPECGELTLASSSTSSLACGSTVAYHQDLRHYVVVECPGKPTFSLRSTSKQCLAPQMWKTYWCTGFTSSWDGRRPRHPQNRCF